MAESRQVTSNSERTKSVRQIFEQNRSIAQRLGRNGATKDRIAAIADRYAQNIRAYLGDNYNIDTQVPVSVYMGRRNNRRG